jgi:tRNA pseudouridine38-40 synthase
MEKVLPAGQTAMRLAFRLAYIGTDFFGSQVQPGIRTVEGEVIAACTRLGLFADWREAGFSCSGRTDRGVHARGQVCAFSTEVPSRAVTALTHTLPRDCWCTGFVEVPDTFHPRFMAHSRTYRYYFLMGGIDLQAIATAAPVFIGSHRFSTFARVQAGKDPVRHISNIRLVQEGPLPAIEVTAESFLWHMVRGMAAGLLAVGRGEWTRDDLASCLDGKDRPRIPPAPPEGLVLWNVDCGLSFQPIPLRGGAHSFLYQEKQLHQVLGGVLATLDR